MEEMVSMAMFEEAATLAVQSMFAVFLMSGALSVSLTLLSKERERAMTAEINTARMMSYRLAAEANKQIEEVQKFLEENC